MNVILKDDFFLPVAKMLLNQAQTSIYISSFKLELSPKPRGRKLVKFFDALSQRQKEGIDIRVLTNKQNEQGYVPASNGRAINYLKKNQIKVRCLPNQRLTHAKMILIDSNRALVGSHNLSIKSCHSNFEVSCFVSDIESIKYLSILYDHVWEKAKDA